ncbi:cyclic nucleotide-binding protein [Streptomyces sp. BK239]|nr:cyclic nucleotide-binding protein [Streptomyces sp. BK239]
MLQALPAEHRQRLMRFAREVSFPQGTRLFEEGGRADRFWIIRTGSVDLDMRVPGRRAAVIETLRHDELIGWSWLFAPHTWHVRRGDQPGSRLRVRRHRDPLDVQGRLRSRRERHPVGGSVLAHRLRSTRIRLLDLYAPYGSGSLL